MPLLQGNEVPLGYPEDYSAYQYLIATNEIWEKDYPQNGLANAARRIRLRPL